MHNIYIFFFEISNETNGRPYCGRDIVEHKKDENHRFYRLKPIGGRAKNGGKHKLKFSSGRTCVKFFKKGLK
jgi:hypothetical protein